jgi:hypothetical protein
VYGQSNTTHGIIFEQAKKRLAGESARLATDHSLNIYREKGVVHGYRNNGQTFC